ncbi:methyl-accepting chemotaxis protein [Pseudomonas putida]|uniref:methyl-accepting chemotaxis protein n=1 Tax=Pseudomonas putida TaxID=303 RepID=UPI0018ABA2FC|nr:methyl-accepting chemotaxis protein [Pseudomonas putida]MBF8670251.1 methyl-accepting chemotaxis protein [Pseudomonas putida]MBF8713125.1 methyl-accepting chemotaxis protein [Pseudomonas putida]
MNLRSINIGRRCSLIFSLIGLLTLVLGLTAIMQTRSMNTVTDELRRHWLPGIMATGDISNNLGRIRSLSLRSVIEQDKDDMDKIEALKANIANAMTNYEATIQNQTDRELFSAFSKEYSQYLSVLKRVLQTLDDRAATVHLIKTELSPQADATMVALNTLAKFNSESGDHAADKSESSYHAALNTILTALTIIMLVMVISSVLLTRSIVRPMSDAIAIAQRISGNDLTQDIQVKERDEPGQLIRTLKEMQENLRKTLQQIAQSSDQLASAAEELHAVTEDTNRGLHQQSTEIEQAATAVNEMTAVVEEVASNAANTAQASQEADGTTRQGQEQVAQTLGSLQQLVDDVSSTSSEIAELANRANEINRVLEVIGAIAEQTNLLALNAAIEAARAGEAGRGFAVVADEVRALAHRTQESTGEIEQMISGIRSGTVQAVNAMQASESRANSTLEIAKAAGRALTEISESISTINGRNLVIASASEEQAQVAREVDRNLINIRDLSTQTSTGADQTSAASQTLSQLAIELNSLVAKFKI